MFVIKGSISEVAKSRDNVEFVDIWISKPFPQLWFYLPNNEKHFHWFSPHESDSRFGWATFPVGLLLTLSNYILKMKKETRQPNGWVSFSPGHETGQKASKSHAQ